MPVTEWAIRQGQRDAHRPWWRQASGGGFVLLILLLMAIMFADIWFE